MPTVYTNYKRIPFKTLLAIKENRYRSKDAKRDYCPIGIEEEIIRKTNNAQVKEEKEFLKSMDDFEKEKSELKTLIQTLRIYGTKFLTEETLKQITDELAYKVANFK